MSNAFTYSDNDKLIVLLQKAYYFFLDLNTVWGLTEKEHTRMLTLIEELIPIIEKLS